MEDRERAREGEEGESNCQAAEMCKDGENASPMISHIKEEIVPGKE